MALNDTAELLATIRLRGSLPVVSPDWTDVALLQLATRIMNETHLPMLLAARGEYLVKIIDIPLVAGQRDYRLPARCCAVRQVSYLQSDGTLTPINEAKPAELENFTNVNTQGRPQLFTFREHYLELWPKPASTGDTIRVRYHMRPSRMYPTGTTHAAVLTNVQTATPTAEKTRLTMAAVPSTPFSLFDIVKPTSPFDITSFDLASVFSTGTTLDVLTSTLAVTPSIGDYLCVGGYSVFPNCPEELHHAIALRTAAAVVAARGDSLAGALVAEAEDKEKKLLVGILAPRSKGNPKIIRSRRWG